MKRTNIIADLQGAGRTATPSLVQEEVLSDFTSGQRHKYANERVPSVLSREQGQKYIEWLDKKSSFDDLADLFKRDNLEQLFGVRAKQVLSKVLIDILEINDKHNSSSPKFFERKLSVLRNVLRNAVEEQNSDVAIAVINRMIDENSSEYPDEKRKLTLEFRKTIDGSNGLLDGLTSMRVMGGLLASPFINPLIFAMDLFSDEDLVRNIFTKAYEDDYNSAHESAGGIIDFLKTRELPGMHSERRVQYGKVVSRIETINSEVTANVGADTPERSNYANQVTVQVLSARPNVNLIAASDLISNESNVLVVAGKSVNNLTTYLKDPKIKSPKIEINASKYLPSNRDMVEGLSMMIDILPDSSPLRHKLEDFLANMPVYVKELKPDLIKKELLGLLKPIFSDRGFDRVNIVGSEFSSLKKAYYAVKNKLDKALSWEERRNIPNLEYFLGDTEFGSIGWAGIQSQYTGINLKAYESGEKTFVGVASLFCERYSDKTIPLHQYARSFIEHYKEIIVREIDPKFTIDLQSSHNYLGKIRTFMRFLGEASMQDQSLGHAVSMLISACEKYTKLQLNDQTFLDEVKRLQSYCMDSHGPGPGVARDIDYLINAFMQSNHS